jgi:hypothetical protein
MPFDAPFTLGPFEVDAEGRLSPGEPDVAPAFLFRWHGRLIRARLARAENGLGRLVLQVTVGRVRSSASLEDDTQRPRNFTLLRWLMKTAPMEWHVTLLADHRVWLESYRPIDLPITAAALITEITRFALALAPYLDLADEDGLTLSDYAVT